MEELPKDQPNVSISPNVTNGTAYPKPVDLIFEESEKQFLSRLRNLGVIPDDLVALQEVRPEALDIHERELLSQLTDVEQEIFKQSLLAYGWLSYTLATMGLMRVLESCVELLFNKEQIENPKRPNPPNQADPEICKKCEICQTYFSGLKAKIEKLSEQTKNEQVKNYLLPVIEFLKRLGQSKKHINSELADKTVARQLIASIISLLKSIKNET
ncbi:MAG: hypothetical protein WCT08_03685 [Patescibacteria group bacterium]|jgi:hypothetical protein